RARGCRSYRAESAGGTKAWPGRSAQCRPPFPPPPARPLTARAAPRRADRRPSPSADSPASPRNAKGKPSSPSPLRQPRPLPSSTHPPSESEDRDRFSFSPPCHAQIQSIALLMLSPPLDMKEKWFAPHSAYSMAKFGMSLVVLGLAGEFRNQGVAVNALWPRTTIATSAVQNVLGGDALMRASRLSGDGRALTRQARRVAGRR